MSKNFQGPGALFCRLIFFSDVDTYFSTMILLFYENELTSSLYKEEKAATICYNLFY